MDNLKSLLMVCGIALIFLTGVLASYALGGVYVDKESPYLIGFGHTNEQPGNWVSEGNIEVLSDRVIIHVQNAEISRYAASGSMLPTLGENANGIKIVPKSAEDIHIGDIISFESQGLLIVHRVVSKGTDANGDWFVTKGDNNSQTDGKVYFKDVRYVTIALIY